MGSYKFQPIQSIYWEEYKRLARLASGICSNRLAPGKSSTNATMTHRWQYNVLLLTTIYVHCMAEPGRVIEKTAVPGAKAPAICQPHSPPSSTGAIHQAFVFSCSGTMSGTRHACLAYEDLDPQAVSVLEDAAVIADSLPSTTFSAFSSQESSLKLHG